jgi:hypothetical protein
MPAITSSSVISGQIHLKLDALMSHEAGLQVAPSNTKGANRAKTFQFQLDFSILVKLVQSSVQNAKMLPTQHFHTVGDKIGLSQPQRRIFNATKKVSNMVVSRRLSKMQSP